MALSKRKGVWYGDSRADLIPEIERYSALNGYPAVRFSAAQCVRCRGDTFRLTTDDDCGVAIRTCAACGAEAFIGDSAEYVEEAEPETSVCLCGNEHLELTLGVALYADTNDVRWCYIGARCPKCELVGVFSDYKAEAGDADAFLRRA